MKTLLGLILASLITTQAARAANLPTQCYQDAMGYVNSKVRALSPNVVSVGRLGEPAATEYNASNGIADVHFEIEAQYSNGAVAEYLVVVPVQVDDEGGCSVAGQASIKRLN
jgi:hypothetical protein